jgi:hypothetical protein
MRRGIAISKSKQHGQSAYTLAEVLVATFLLGTMTISLFAGFSAGFWLTQMAREDERATQILKGRIEVLRLAMWEDLNSNPYMSFREHFDPSAATTNANGTVSNPSFQYLGTNWISTATNVIPGNLQYANNMRLLTVQVQWTNHNGTNVLMRQRQMQTLVARDGIQNYPWGP